MRLNETYFSVIMQEINSATPQNSVEILALYTSYETKLGQLLGLFSWRKNNMATRAKRPDQSGKAKTTYQKARKIIFASQTVCGICGRPVDFNKKFPDPWSATVDHITPIQKGGDPTALDNLQLAHLQCNRIKATRIVQVQVKEKHVSNRDLPLSFDWSKVGR